MYVTYINAKLQHQHVKYYISMGGAFKCQSHGCGTLKCENAAICEKVAKCEKNSTLNVKIDAICEKITLNVKK